MDSDSEKPKPKAPEAVPDPALEAVPEATPDPALEAVPEVVPDPTPDPVPTPAENDAGHGAGTPVQVAGANSRLIASHDAVQINQSLEMLASGQARILTSR